MRDSDSKKIELIYEAMDGGSYPQYGSNAPIVVAPMGTENLNSAYVDIPNAAKEHDVDPEELEGESPLVKVLDELRNTIRKYEDRKKERESIELDKELEESTINEAGLLGGIANTAGSFIRGAKDPASAVKNAYGYWQDKNKKSEGTVSVGFDEKKIEAKTEIKPERGMAIVSPQGVKATVIDINEPNKEFTVKLENGYVFVQKLNQTGWIIERDGATKEEDIADLKNGNKAVSQTITISRLTPTLLNWTHASEIEDSEYEDQNQNIQGVVAKNVPVDGDKVTFGNATYEYSLSPDNVMEWGRVLGITENNPNGTSVEYGIKNKEDQDRISAAWRQAKENQKRKDLSKATLGVPQPKKAKTKAKTSKTVKPKPRPRKLAKNQRGKKGARKRIK